MDTDQRVLRFDSFSKILSAGIRLGWATGPKPLIDRIALHEQSTILHPSGLSQMVLSAVLHQWGQDGFQKHTQSVAQFYQQKRDAFIKSAEKHLTGLAEWTVPHAGMFVWIKLLDLDDSFDFVKTKAIEKKVLLVPGKVRFEIHECVGILPSLQ
jgi:kynurenine/2-aminoadipate aminotransferase